MIIYVETLISRENHGIVRWYYALPLSTCKTSGYTIVFSLDTTRSTINIKEQPWKLEQ